MPDMLVRLYALPDPATHYERASTAGFTVRRVEPWERAILRQFIRDNFTDFWAAEAERCLNHTPVSGFVGVRDGQVAGFAVYECTRRGFFGPTGVREDLRGSGLGSALLFRCLEAMREMGYAYAIIGGVGPAEFYERTAGATVIPGSEVSIFGPLADFIPREATT